MKLNSSKQIIPLSLALFALLSYNFIGAQWIPAPANPPDNNVAAPLNTGPVNQVKVGNIALGEGRIGANQFVAFDRIRSNQYCDLNGNNCTTASSIYSSVNSASGAVPTGAVMAFALSTCPSGWSAYAPAAGRFILGTDGTRTPGSTQAQVFPAHNHESTVGSGSGNPRSVRSAYWPYGTTGRSASARRSEGSNQGTSEGTIWSGPAENVTGQLRPANVALLYCRKS